MSMAVVLCDFLTFTWLAFLATRSVIRMQQYGPSAAGIVTCIYFLFCGLPLALDYLIGLPEYKRYPGFFLASRHEVTRIVYCLYVSFAPLIWLWSDIGSNQVLDGMDESTQEFMQSKKRLLWLAALAPLAFSLFVPDWSVYAQYSLRDRNFKQQAINVATIHSYLAGLCMVSTVAAAALMLAVRRLFFGMLVLLPILSFNMWITGKRHAIAFALFLVFCALWYRGVFRHRRLAMYGVAAASVAVLLGFSFYYQSHVRGIDLSLRGSSDVYDDVRVDYGRDDVIRLSIFAELKPDVVTILSRRAESLWIYLTLPVPRGLWPDKPLSYGTNMQCAAEMIPRDYLGYGMTTSILEEAIANFGFAGMLIGPLCIALACRITERQQSPLGRISGILVCVLLLTVHLSAFAPLFLVWLMLAVREWLIPASDPDPVGEESSTLQLANE